MRKSTALVAAVVLLALTLIAVVANQQSVAQAPDVSRSRLMLTWEYKTITQNAAEATESTALNKLGAAGWELCAAVPNGEAPPFLILKRSVNNGRGGRVRQAAP
jgi:hypothetical protein